MLHLPRVRANDVPAAGCALFGVVLCRKGGSLSGYSTEYCLWCCAAVVRGARGEMKGGLCGCFCGFCVGLCGFGLAGAREECTRRKEGRRKEQEGEGASEEWDGWMEEVKEGARRAADSGRHATEG